MSSWISRALLGAALSLGVGFVPAVAQHEHSGHEHGQQTTPPALPKCPVMDEPINFAASVATDDGPVFFCCKDCILKYQADVDKYSAKVAAQRKALAERPRVQVSCPVSGRPIDQKVFVEHNGGKVYFCCPGCTSKFRQDPDKYKKALANSYTYQTKCPISGDDVNPQAFTTLASGLKVYYCCKGCEKKLLNDPVKYADELASQGLTVSADELKPAEQEKQDPGAPGRGEGD